jgi:hypothetical protein
MRRNVVDGAIFGVSIGAIVFFAQLFFDSAPWVQAAFVVLGGMLLFAIHLLLQRIRAGLARRARTTDTQRTSDAPPPVRSPRLDWNGHSTTPVESVPLPINGDAALPHTPAATRSTPPEANGDEQQPAQENQANPSHGKEA